MSRVYLDLVENFLSSELGVGFDAPALEALDELTTEQLRLFHHQWSEVDRGEHEAMVQPPPWLRGSDTARELSENKMPSGTPARTSA